MRILIATATNPSSLSWDTAWHGNMIFLFDMSRGIEILRLKSGTARVAKLRTAHEPRRASVRSDPLAARPVGGLTPGRTINHGERRFR